MLSSDGTHLAFAVTPWKSFTDKTMTFVPVGDSAEPITVQDFAKVLVHDMVPEDAGVARARTLYERATPSHFGKGHETVFDESVRRSSELVAGRDVVFDRETQDTANGMAAHMAYLFGFTSSLGRKGGHFEARLHKIVFYEEGGKFLTHVDTPHAHEDNVRTVGSMVFKYTMFTKKTDASGTVVVQRKVKGGELVVDHDKISNKDTQNAITCFEIEMPHRVASVREGATLSVTMDLVFCATEGTEAAVVRVKRPVLTRHHGLGKMFWLWCDPNHRKYSYQASPTKRASEEDFWDSDVEPPHECDVLSDKTWTHRVEDEDVDEDDMFERLKFAYSRGRSLVVILPRRKFLRGPSLEAFVSGRSAHFIVKDLSRLEAECGPLHKELVVVRGSGWVEVEEDTETTETPEETHFEVEVPSFVDRVNVVALDEDALHAMTMSCRGGTYGGNDHSPREYRFEHIGLLICDASKVTAAAK